MCLESVSIRVFLVCLRNWSSKKFKKIHSIKTMPCNMNEYINYNIYQWKMRRLWKVNLSSLMCTSIILILLSCNGKGDHIIIINVLYDFIITINLQDIHVILIFFLTSVQDALVAKSYKIHLSNGRLLDNPIFIVTNTIPLIM